MSIAEKIIKSREKITDGLTLQKKLTMEGGCGVIGFASSTRLPGKHLLSSLMQMKNRGNGKGGGVAILGLSSFQLGVDQQILENDYIIQIAYLNKHCRNELEDQFINSKFIVDKSSRVNSIEDYRSIGLEVKPPEVYRYFCKVKEEQLLEFMDNNNFKFSKEKAADEYVYQNTYELNRKYYSSKGEKNAFVLSHSKNMLVFKMVGYADQVIHYYKLDEFLGNIWVGHHRYPTKGNVWHPGGAHPFIGLHEALVHNGDFSNYHSVTEYLAQRSIYPLFLTDTEVAVYLFDLYSRVYEYPTEYLIEAIAPTTERDFWMLPAEKREVYNQIQQSHIQGSPDGPWFFIVGRSIPLKREIELWGITDTSMLRPQVFALQEGEEQIGLIGSELQAIDAVLNSLATENNRFSAKADIYWNARGGSYTDGGAFVFQIDLNQEKPKLKCTDKFGKEITSPRPVVNSENLFDLLSIKLGMNLSERLLVHSSNKKSLIDLCTSIQNLNLIKQGVIFEYILSLTQILDKMHLLPNSKNGKVRELIENTLYKLFRSFPTKLNSDSVGLLVDKMHEEDLILPINPLQKLFIDIGDFEIEGDKSAALFIVNAYKMGWKNIYTFNWRGHRFGGCGLGPNSDGLRIDVYGNPGDYLASGLDGAEIYVHCSAQDQVGQMMKSGKLIIFGDVGQTFLYGAKGGEIYILGNAAGRPLINAVGKPRVIINGTCLDYLAEGFMAGDPLNGGGFAIINGIRFDNNGKLVELETPYPGGNLLSLASGGAIYIRDPNSKVEENQLNGGMINGLSKLDLILLDHYLATNEELFGIPAYLSNPRGLTNDKLYRKIEPAKIKELVSG